MLFLESPPGVGFSINKDPSYTYSDSRTAQDNLMAISQWFKKFPEFSGNNFWISGESYCGMYIPLLANQVLNNIDKIIEGKRLAFKGILIGNGVMLTESHWRRQARNTFFSRHYFYGPEIQGLIANCKYDASDDTNASCMMGNKLADEVLLSPLRPHGASILITASAFAMLRNLEPTASHVGDTGTVHSMSSCTTRWRKNQAAARTKMEFRSSSTTKRSKSNSMCLICCGSPATTRLVRPSKKTPALWVYSRGSRLQDLRSCSSPAMWMHRCPM